MHCRDLGVVFSLAGATCGPIVIFIFPGIFWWKFGPKGVWWKHKGLCYLFWTAGATIITMGTSTNAVMDMINPPS
jgi:hypothetical protein